MISYVYDCFYWYKYEALGKWFVDAPGKRFHVRFLGCENWFMSIRISKIKDHFISVDQARYANYIMDNYIGTATVNASTKFYKNTLSSDMIFPKDAASTSDDKVEKLTR